MADGFVNMNRFRHGKALNQHCKQYAASRSRAESRGRRPDILARIDVFASGSTTIEGSKYCTDGLVFANVTERKERSRFVMFDSHESRRRELEELSQGQPEAMVAGLGTDDAAGVVAEARH